MISGDSTVRHFFNRLVAVIRQQDNVIDGGGIAHAHYKLQLWPGSSETAGVHSTCSSSSSDKPYSTQPSVAGSAGGFQTFPADAAGAGFVTDQLWVSPPANFAKGSWDEDYMAEGLLHLLNRTFAGGGASSSGSGGGGGSSGDSSSVDSPQLTVDFLVGAHARWQMRHVKRYLAQLAATPGADGSRVLAVLSLCVWEQKHVWPNGWQAFLEEVTRQVGQVVLLTCPTDRIQRENQQEGRKIVAERNRLLRAMVAAEHGGSATAAAGAGPVERQLKASGDSGSRGGQLGAAGTGGSGRGEGSHDGASQASSSGSSASSSRAGGSSRGSNRAGSSSQTKGSSVAAGRPLKLVDIESLTQDLPPGLAVAPLDYHYACMLANPAGYNSTGNMLFTGGDGRPQPAYQPMRYDRLLVPPAGRCDDPVNFASIQLLLSLLD